QDHASAHVIGSVQPATTRRTGNGNRHVTPWDKEVLQAEPLVYPERAESTTFLYRRMDGSFDFVGGGFLGNFWRWGGSVGYLWLKWLTSKPLPHLHPPRLPFSGDRTTEVEEHFQGSGTGPVKELETARGDAVHVAGLLDGEHGGQLTPADVHVQRIGL